MRVPESAPRLASVRVDEVLAGDVASEILIEQEASLLDGTPIEVNGVAPLEAGQAGIYFLIAGDGEEFPYFACVNRQGDTRSSTIGWSREQRRSLQAPGGDDPGRSALRDQ